MKKNKLLILCLLTMIFVLGFSKKAFAAASTPQEILWSLDCRYAFEYFDDNAGNPLYNYDLKNEYFNRGYMQFWYSQVNFEDEFLSDSLFTYHYANSLYEWQDIQEMKNDMDANFGAKGTGADSTFISSFVNIVNNNMSQTTKKKYDNVCPKYMVAQLRSDRKATEYMYFVDDPKVKCGNDKKGCLYIAKLSGGAAKTLYPGEDHWNLTTTGGMSCDGANLSFYINKGDNVLKTQISYPETSSFYEKTTKKTVTFNAKLCKKCGSLSAINAVNNLISHKKIDSFSFLGIAGEETFVFSQKIDKKNYCYSTDAFQVKNTKACLSIAHAKPQYEDLKNAMLEAYGPFAVAVGKLANEKTDNTFEPKDFSGYNKKQLLELIDEVTNYGEEDLNVVFKTFTTNYETYIKKLEELAGKSEFCASAKAELSQLAETEQNNLTSFKLEAEAAKKAMENVRKRLEELGASDADLDKADDILDPLDDLVDDIDKIIKIIDVIFILTDVNITFNFTEGCGMITTGFSKWLQQALDIIKVCGLLLTLILGMVDFFKGVASGSAETMKKVWTSFSRRLIVVVILFLLPVILEFVLGLANISGVVVDNPLCGLK